MNSIGPRYTGNDAHRTFVEYLAKNLQATGIHVQRDTSTITRWNATKWGLKLSHSGGVATDVPVTFYYPYSGATSAEGVTGELLQIPNVSKPTSTGAGTMLAAPGDLTGKVVFIEVPGIPAPSDWLKQPWGFYTEDTTVPTYVSAVWGGVSVGWLGDLKKAGAVGVILGWTNISDAQARYQYTPYGRPFQDLPAIWVGKESTAKLRSVAGTGGKATVILQAEIVPNVSVDSLYGVLPGMSSDSVLIVESHSDGMNALEENGALAILALAKYFSHLPKESRKRDIVFVVANHFARADVTGITGWINKHPDLIKRAAAYVTVEHLGCREWFDNAAGEYAPSGKNEVSFVISGFEGTAKTMLESAKRGSDKRVAVVRGPRVPGEGGPLFRAGVPGIAFFPAPTYLLTGPENGYIEKLSKTLIHAQIQDVARVIQKLDGMSAEEIKGSSSQQQ
jgi:hypothetical protein